MRLLLAATLLTLASCAATAEDARQQAADRQARADSAKRADWHAPLPAPPQLPRKVKGDLTVIHQYAAPGGSNTADAARTDNRKAGQHQGSAATGPGSTAGNASKRTAGPPWQVYAGVAVALLLVGAIGCYKLCK